MNLLRAAAKVPRSIRRRGLRATVATAWVHVRRSRTGRLHLYLTETAFDVVHGVNTRGIVKHEKVGAFQHAFRYEASPLWKIRRVLKDVPVDARRFTFVDLGCGRGLVLLLAARRGFRRVVGVELSTELAEAARANAADYRRWGRRAPLPIDVFESDATTWPLPDEPLVVYVYNSFARPGFDRLAETVGATLRENPREMFLVYMFPESREALDGVQELSVVREDPQYVIYRARPQLAPTGAAGVG